MKEKKDLIYENDVYQFANGDEVYCPVCYMEREGLLSPLVKKKNILYSDSFWQCSNPECGMKIFPDNNKKIES